MLDSCSGARSAFVSYDGRNESLIDHKTIPVEKVDLIRESLILEDDAVGRVVRWCCVAYVTWASN